MQFHRRFLVFLFGTIGFATAAFGAESALSLAKSALARGDAGQAVRLAKQAEAASPNDAACCMTLAAAYDAQGEYDKAIVPYNRAIQLAPNLVAAYLERGQDHFRLGHFKESVQDFDKVVALLPAKEPYLWQRGIALYYNGEFSRAAKQFELHKKVNPDDVENAAWHYLCVAKISGPAQAREGLMPIQRDTRVPFMEIYALFAGKLTPRDVVSAAQAGAPRDEELAERLFYAHFYIGLFELAEGNIDAARYHVYHALEQPADVGYMGDVARAQAAEVNLARPIK